MKLIAKRDSNLPTVTGNEGSVCRIQPQATFGLTPGKAYLAETRNVTSIDEDFFVYLKTDLGMRNVRMSRFRKSSLPRKYRKSV